MAVTTRTGLILALAAAILPMTACSTAATTEEEILFGTADTAVFVGDFARIAFWEIPRFLLWTAPKAVLYDFPRAGVLALSGTSANVGSLIEKMRDPTASDEEVLRISRELGEITGIPLRSREDWIDWWTAARDVPAGRWRRAFADHQVDLLVSPDYFERSAAFGRLQEMYGASLDYDPKLDEPGLGEAASRWRARVRDD